MVGMPKMTVGVMGLKEQRMAITGMVLGVLALVLVWTASTALSAISGEVWTKLGVGVGLYMVAEPMIALGLFLSVGSYRKARRNAAGTLTPIVGMVTNTAAGVMLLTELLAWVILLGPRFF